jgi:hypothetical protein
MGHFNRFILYLFNEYSQTSVMKVKDGICICKFTVETVNLQLRVTYKKGCSSFKSADAQHTAMTLTSFDMLNGMDVRYEHINHGVL